VRPEYGKKGGGEMGLLKNLRKKLGGARPRRIAGPLGHVRQCPECRRDLQVIYLVGNGDRTATVGMSCLTCGELFEEVTQPGAMGF
jgi:transcription elongation factor Elf1